MVGAQCFHVSDFLVRRHWHPRSLVDVEDLWFVRLAMHMIDAEHNEQNEAQKHDDCTANNTCMNKYDKYKYGSGTSDSLLAHQC